MSRRTRTILRKCIIVVTVMGLGLAGCALWFVGEMPLPFPDYRLDLDVSGEGPYFAGSAKVLITPEVPREDGEPVWLAGYDAGRAATGIHDDLWARALVLRAGEVTVAIVVLDLIGLFHHEVIAIRKGLDPALGVDYVVVATTHTHSGPDTLGLWGKTRLQTGLRYEYQGRVRLAAISAIEKAAASLSPAALVFARRKLDPEGILSDNRKPIVMDPELSVCEVRRRDGTGTIATVVNWSCHPEVLYRENTLITSDFPHYLRLAMERETAEGADPPGLGGICLFLAGSIGGLQTPLEIPVRDQEGRLLPESSFAKAEVIGERLAAEALGALRGEESLKMAEGPLRVRARTVLVPLQNFFMKVASKIAVIQRGSVEGRNVRTEVGWMEVGPVPFLFIPGEIYPEIVVGGIEAPVGQDFAIPPQEVPPLKDEMGDGVRFVVGLANDELGYLIPKSEWDESSPYLYGADSSPYGEKMSPGPDAAGIIHREALRLIRGAARGR